MYIQYVRIRTETFLLTTISTINNKKHVLYNKFDSGTYENLKINKFELILIYDVRNSNFWTLCIPLCCIAPYLSTEQYHIKYMFSEICNVILFLIHTLLMTWHNISPHSEPCRESLVFFSGKWSAEILIGTYYLLYGYWYKKIFTVLLF